MTIIIQKCPKCDSFEHFYTKKDIMNIKADKKPTKISVVTFFVRVSMPPD